MLKSFFNVLPGKSFDYQSGSTQLLSLVIEKANYKKINDLVSEWLWDPIGAENDALWMVDSKENNELKAYCGGEREIQVSRELTKKFEENISTNIDNLLTFFKEKEIIGEIDQIKSAKMKKQ